MICPTCHGKGFVHVGIGTSVDQDWVQLYDVCEDCQGSGFVH